MHFYTHLTQLKYVRLVSFIAIAAIASFACSADTQKPSQGLTLENLSLKIDARIHAMKLIAKSIANDPFIHDWVETGFKAEKEQLLLDKLGFFVDEYALTSASFADKNSNKYWNHEGFLRVLVPSIDTWYFNYLRSAEQDLISVYHDKNKKRVDIYVNYQQLKGPGLSGIATSFDGVLTMLATSSLAANGQLYLVKPDGSIKLDANEQLAENTLIQDTYYHTSLNKVFPPSSVQADVASQSVQRPANVEVILLPHMTWFLVFVEMK